MGAPGLLGSLDGWGKVSVPDGYVRETSHWRMPSTVHKSQGPQRTRPCWWSTKRRPLSTSMWAPPEGANNLACVVCEPVDQGHRHWPAPRALDQRCPWSQRKRAVGHGGLPGPARTGGGHEHSEGGSGRASTPPGPDRSQEIERLRQKLAGRTDGARRASQPETGPAGPAKAEATWLSASPR